MNFKQATDALIAGVTLEDLAEAIGVSVQAVRQARSAEGTTSYRTPPQGWEAAVAMLASRRAEKLEKLSNKLNH